MQHRIPLDSLPRGGREMARAIETCVHCGFCLPSCPTYRVLGEEMDSPRGRIVLMKQVLEGELAAQDVMPYVDRCLGCLGCETSCPSGVHYRDLLVPFRAKAERESRPAVARWRARALLALLESPALFRIAVRSWPSRTTRRAARAGGAATDAASAAGVAGTGASASVVSTGDRSAASPRRSPARVCPAGAGTGHQSRHHAGPGGEWDRSRHSAGPGLLRCAGRACRSYRSRARASGAAAAGLPAGRRRHRDQYRRLRIGDEGLRDAVRWHTARKRGAAIRARACATSPSSSPRSAS